MQQKTPENQTTSTTLLATLRHFTEKSARNFVWKMSVFHTHTHNCQLIIVAAIVGVFPLWSMFLLEKSWHQIISTALMLPFFWSLVLQNRIRSGIFFVAIVYIFHGLTAIFIAKWHGAAVAYLFPGSENYWQATYNWITSGIDPEYDPKHWMPHHCLLLFGISFFSAVTLAFVPLLQGFVETDLMNYYVGNLLQISDNQLVAFGVGWHMWSVMRGISYTIIVFEMTSWTLEKWSGLPLSTPSQRRKRWCWGLFFFFMDGILKYFTIEQTRLVLEQNLLK